MTKSIVRRLTIFGAVVCFSGCGGRQGAEANKPGAISNAGSDTMVNLAQAWAEAYGGKTGIKVQVLGGGSGVGIAGLIDGTCDMANASREMKNKEIELARARRGQAPKEHVVGYDGLAVYVHKNNPLNEIAIETLAEIYGEGGKIDEWSAVSEAAARLGKIVRVSRQNSSGTYVYFREAILGEGRDYKLGSIDQSGSKDVVALVGRTPGAIGYSGMGYATPEVKMLGISKTGNDAAVAPTIENAKSGAYPINRALYIYTIGEPTGEIKEYIEWIMSQEGQKVVEDLGYVPVK